MGIVLSAVVSFVLKMLGAALLLAAFFLLFIIVMLCLILLCPIRYRGKAEYDGNLMATGKVTWLFSLLSVSFSYLEGEVDSKIRILGIDLLKFLEKRQKRDVDSEKQSSETKKKQKKKKSKDRKSKNQPDLQISQIEENLSEDTKSDDKTTMPNLEISEVSEKETHQPDLEISEVSEEETRQPHLEISEGAEEKRLSRFFQRIKEWLLLPWKKIKRFFRGLRKAYKNVKSRVEWLGKIKEFWKSENTQGMVCIFKDNVLHLLRKIKPKVLRGTVFFGTGDPCTTGQILGVAAILYAAYGSSIQVIPDFEKARLEGELYAKGRLFVITIVFIVIKIFRSKEWKQFKYDFDQLKEAL